MSESNPIKALTPEEAIEIGYERSEPDAVQIGGLTVVIVFTILATCYAVYYWYVGQLEYTRHMEVEVPIWQELKDVRAAETERLTQYKYLDKSKGTVTLPIEKSMELLIQESNAGKSFYAGKNSAVVPYEVDPGMQAVIDKALGKTPAPPPPAPAVAAPEKK
jgi:hypothetical protein